MPRTRPVKETPPRKLTDRQREILEWVIGYIESHQYPPAIREIGEAFEIKSTNGVFDHLNALVRKGYVGREYFAARSLTILLNPDGTPHKRPEERADKLLAGLKSVRKVLKNAMTRDSDLRDKAVEMIDEILKAA